MPPGIPRPRLWRSRYPANRLRFCVFLEVRELGILGRSAKDLAILAGQSHHAQTASATRSRKIASWRNPSSTGHKKIRWAPADWQAASFSAHSLAGPTRKL